MSNIATHSWHPKGEVFNTLQENLNIKEPFSKHKCSVWQVDDFKGNAARIEARIVFLSTILSPHILATHHYIFISFQIMVRVKRFGSNHNVQPRFGALDKALSLDCWCRSWSKVEFSIKKFFSQLNYLSI